MLGYFNNLNVSEIKDGIKRFFLFPLCLSVLVANKYLRSKSDLAFGKDRVGHKGTKTQRDSSFGISTINYNHVSPINRKRGIPG